MPDRGLGEVGTKACKKGILDRMGDHHRSQAFGRVAALQHERGVNEEVRRAPPCVVGVDSHCDGPVRILGDDFLEAHLEKIERVDVLRIERMARELRLKPERDGGAPDLKSPGAPVPTTIFRRRMPHRHARPCVSR